MREREIYAALYSRLPWRSVLVHPLRAFRCWWQRRAAAAELAAMTDQQLDDIGMPQFKRIARDPDRLLTLWERMELFR